MGEKRYQFKDLGFDAVGFTDNGKLLEHWQVEDLLNSQSAEIVGLRKENEELLKVMHYMFLPEFVSQVRKRIQSGELEVPDAAKGG